MLVAGASVGLLAPIAAQASDVVNLEEMNSYSRSTKKQSSRLDSTTFINEVSEDLAILKGRVDGLEVKQNVLEAGGFSDTTVMNGKAIFDIGGVENSSGDLSEAVGFQYTHQLNLNTSFTGDDDLYVRLKTGNATDVFSSKTYGTYLSSSNGNDDEIKVDKIWYSFPVKQYCLDWSKN